ncbi:unannotated protein [freshwater metagenome]|uniref:Unannotated protein n=1 Tax=freshwater metagenome TaxID=449393 RepID=A0A6J6WF54_9ZZZZ|nr:hypothetical protein [Actinomycetota bacterium]MSZ74983.1 hypothetical protein [Actinomycetota bacterium]
MRNGWVIKQLDEVCTKFGAGPFGSNMKISTFVDAGIPVVSGNHMTELELVEESFNYITEDHANRMQSSIVQRNDVVITKAGTIGQVSLIPENSRFLKYVLSSRQLFARPNVGYVVPKYLAIYLKYGRGQAQILSNVNRTGVPSLSQAVSFIKNVRIELPPLPEQKRIVDLISSVDSYIEALQKQLESAKKSRNAVLYELLTAEGGGWVETTLGKLLTLEYGKPLTDENRDGKGFPVFASAGVVGMHSEPLVSKSPVIVVGRKGTAGAVYWSETPCFVIDTAYYVKPLSDLDLRFLYLLLTFIDLKSVTAQTGVPGLNRDRAYSLKCNVPPISKQLEVVKIITQLDDFIDSTQGTINRSQDLRSGLLSDLLSGVHEIHASYDKVIGAA